MRTDLPRLYNTTDNPVDLASSDVVAVFEYLKANGVPDPVDVIREVAVVPAPPNQTNYSYVRVAFVWTDESRPDPLLFEGYMLMNNPQFVIAGYRQWAGKQVRPLPEEYAPPKPPEPKPEEPKKPKLAHEGEPGYVRKTNGFFVWWEKA